MKASTLFGVIIVIVVVVAGAAVLLKPEETADNGGTQPLVEEKKDSDGEMMLKEDDDASRDGEDSDEVTHEEESNDDTDSDQATTSEVIEVINIEDGSFSPSELTISAGTTVSFINNGQAKHWPASDVHPTHKSYPGSDIAKCGSDESSTIFDACRGLETGEQYSFTFTEEGSWDLHDHLFPRMKGTITVE